MGNPHDAASDLMDIAVVSDDLTALWLAPFSREEWQGRLELLEDIDEEIRITTPQTEMAREISRQLTTKLINELKLGPVRNVPQAYIYLNSADHAHRESARVWLVLNGHEGVVSWGDESADPRAGSEKRSANRYEVNLESVVSFDTFQTGAKLVDISASGAKLAISGSLPAGTRVELVVPMLGRIAASVVWVAATFVGLSFILDQGAPLFG